MFTWDHSGASWFRRVNARSRRFARVRLGVAEFICVGMGSLGLASSLSGIAWVYLAAPSGRRVHSGSHRFTWAGLELPGFILVRVGSLGYD